ncbi:uncharacterized protein LOC135486955 [Lineus longissimus]|uniref:uncharacterized protein LOC135486955 n=1 Tax=Lineus longissimus TaxID=88925 RepID=UPI00315C6D7A
MSTPAQLCINDTSEKMGSEGNISLLEPYFNSIKQALQSRSLHHQKDFLLESASEDNSNPSSNIGMEYNKESTEITTDVKTSSEEQDLSLEAPSPTLLEVNGILQSTNAKGATDSGTCLEKEKEEVQNTSRSSAPSLPLDNVELVADEELEANGRDRSGSSMKTTEDNTAENDQPRSPSNGIQIVGREKGNDVNHAPLATTNPLRRASDLNYGSAAEVDARLKQTFNFDVVIALLRETGEVVNIAVNSLAKHVTFQSAVLQCLFGVLKVCDAWNLMLTSYKITANEIIERLHIACLKLVEGFPDFAMKDIQQIEEYVSRLTDAIKKLQLCLVDAMDALKSVEMSIGDDALEADALFIIKRKEKNGVLEVEQNKEEYRLIRRRFRNALYLKLFADSPTEACKLSAEESYQDIMRQGDVIHRSYKQFLSDDDRFEIARMSLTVAHQKYCFLATLLERATILVGTWSNECRWILDSDFGVQINRIKEMTQQERVVVFEESPVMIQLKLYLQRWRSIYKICSENLSSIRPVRDQVEQLYTDNPYPVEAMDRARKAAAEHRELRNVLRLPKWYEPVPLEGAIYKEGNRIYALELILEAKNDTKPNLGWKDESNPFQSDEYIEAKKVMDLSEKLLQIACETAPRPSNYRRCLRGIRRSFRKVQQAVYENILQYREEAAGIAIHLYLVCLSWLQGLPELAKDGFHYGVLDIEGLKNLANVICSKSLTCDAEKIALGFEDYQRNTLEGLIERIDKETKERCDSEAVEDELPEVDQTWYQTLRLGVIGDHIGEIDDVKQAAISTQALKLAIGLPLDVLVRAHLSLGRHIEQLFKEKQRLLVEVDPTEVYARGSQGHNRMDHGLMRRVHDLCKRLNAFRLSCEEEAAQLEEEHNPAMLLSTRSTGVSMTLDECDNMVKRLGDMALVESFRNVLTEIDGHVLKFEEVDGENLAVL